MTSEAKTDILQLNTIQKIFQATLRELYMNPASCEETELHFFVIEKSKGQERICYDGNLLPAAVIPSRTTVGYHSLIKNYIQNILNKSSYVLEESEIFIDNGKLKKVFWVLFSECLESNHGKLLLKCVFRKLADIFNLYLREPVSDVQESDSGVGVAQKILQSAEAQAALYMQKLFAPLNIDFIDDLSGEYYEKSACESNMVFLSNTASKYLSSEDLVYSFSGIEFIPLNRRLIRKLLQIAQDNLYLVLEADEREDMFYAAGICTKNALAGKLKCGDKMTVPYIRVNIKKHMQWDIFLGDTYIFTSRNGHYKIDRELQEEFMIKKLMEYFGGTKEKYQELFRNIQRSTKQAHGTMLVIMEPATALTETLRLGLKQYGLPAPNFRHQGSGTCNHRELIQQEINHLNAIDGCIVFGTDGHLYGIGVILDGLAEKEGSLARGARYNSAIKYLTYLQGKSQKAMILVISEDGSVDICTTDDLKDES